MKTQLFIFSREGLDVRFFVYVRPVFHPRKPVDEKLILDQHNLEYVLDYLNNETSAVDPIMYLKFKNWAEIQGIDIQQIDLRSTCEFFIISKRLNIIYE